MSGWICCSLMAVALALAGLGCAPAASTAAGAVAVPDASSAAGVVAAPDASSSARVYEVLGMNCPGCHGGLVKLVKRLPAVEKAEANWQAKQLIVYVQPGAELSDDDVMAVIRRANFTPGKRLK